ncbi:MAG: TRAP transporter small permease [Nanoarchaeota archaeon]|nr:TRAP transporter small permease [Nanoarchaeota archaeon]
MAASENCLLTLFKWFERYFLRISRWLTLFTGIFALAITVISIREIIFRNLGSPSEWGSEVTELMVLWVFLVPMAYTQMSGGMIRVTFFIEKLPLKVYGLFKLLSSLSSVIFGLLFFRASYMFYSATVAGSYFPETGFPAAVQRAGVPLSALLLVTAGVFCTIKDILAIATGNISKEDSE